MQKELILITGYKALKYINGKHMLSRRHVKWVSFS